MEPYVNLYRVTFEALQRPHFVVAADFGQAEELARMFASSVLESKHQTVTSIKLVAPGCDTIGKMSPAKKEDYP